MAESVVSPTMETMLVDTYQWVAFGRRGLQKACTVGGSPPKSSSRMTLDQDEL